SKGQAAGDESAVRVQHFVGFAIEQDPPVPRHAFFAGVLRADARGAVSGDGIIPAWLRAQCVKRTHIFEETLARPVRRSRGVVKVDVLVAVVCPQADHVALVSDKVDECVLPIEAADRRISLANGLSGLDGKAERWRVSELETHDWMCNPR